MNGHETAVLPPHNLDAEQSVLGAILLTPDVLLEIADTIGLQQTDFYRPGLGLVYAAMLRLRADGDAIDRLTVTEHLRERAKLAEAGGEATVEALAASPPVTGHARDYARIVCELALRRRVQERGMRLVQAAAGSTDVEGVLRVHAEAVAALRGQAEAGGGQRRAKLKRLDTRKMLTTDPPPVDWIALDVIARGHVTMLAGREGEGKSLLCQALATTCASGGGMVAGIACKSAKVLIVDAENGEAVIHRRMKGLGLELENEARLTFVEADGFDLRFDLDELRSLVAAAKPDLLLLDSWRSLWGGKENDSDEVSACLSPLLGLSREAAMGIGLIHHMSRNGQYRGSTAGGSTLEIVLEMQHLPDDPEPTRRQLRAAKCRIDAQPLPRWLRVDAELGALLVDEAEPWAGAGVELAIAPVRTELHPRLLAQLGDEPRTQAAILRAVGKQPNDATGRRVLKALEGTGQAVRTSSGWIRGVTPDTPDTPDARRA